MQIDVTEYRLRTDRPLTLAEATRLRGYFGNEFADEELAHQHRPGGGLVYDYPRVQYKVLGGVAVLIGLGEDGGRVVERAWRESESVRLGDETLGVLEGTVSRRRAELGVSPGPLEYEFQTPWLALNAANSRAYADAPTEAARHDLLARVLVGNILSLSKSFRLFLTERLTADTSRLRPRECRLKGVPMLGFVGRVSVNFCIPAHIGLGKSVSRGFGTLVPVERGASR